jgi:hypothetical protein
VVDWGGADGGDELMAVRMDSKLLICPCRPETKCGNRMPGEPLEWEYT